MAIGMIYMGFNGMIFDGMGLSGDGWGMVWDGWRMVGGWYGMERDGMEWFVMVWDGMGWYCQIGLDGLSVLRKCE